MFSVSFPSGEVRRAARNGSAQVTRALRVELWQVRDLPKLEGHCARAIFDLALHRDRIGFDSAPGKCKPEWTLFNAVSRNGFLPLSVVRYFYIRSEPATLDVVAPAIVPSRIPSEDSPCLQHYDSTPQSGNPLKLHRPHPFNRVFGHRFPLPFDQSVYSAPKDLHGLSHATRERPRRPPQLATISTPELLRDTSAPPTAPPPCAPTPIHLRLRSPATIAPAPRVSTVRLDHVPIPMWWGINKARPPRIGHHQDADDDQYLADCGDHQNPPDYVSPPVVLARSPRVRLSSHSRARRLRPRRACHRR